MSMVYTRLVQTVDSHTEGNATRVIVGGVRVPPGKTLLEKRAWLKEHDDGLRQLLNFEPRGNDCMCSVLLLPPESDSSDFSVIIMEQNEYVPMCGHCMIGTATTVVATGMIKVQSKFTAVRFDTPAGIVECHVEVDGGVIRSVCLDNVESFVLQSGATIDVEGYGQMTVDIAYGGDMYAFVDADAIDLQLTSDNDQNIIETGRLIRSAVGTQLSVAHPKHAHINSCYQILFTSRGVGRGDYKQAVCLPPGALDRSPCGTGTSAHVALLYTKGEIGLNQRRNFEGPLGTCFGGEALTAHEQNGIVYVRPRITGRAYITGFHQFVLEPGDPLPQGYRLGSAVVGSFPLSPS